MRAVVKSISNDNFDIDGYLPEKLDCFYLDLRVLIGVDGESGADDFEIFVCTPKWLEETLWGNRWGRGLLIIREYDLSVIKKLICEYVNNCEGDGWEAIVVQLERTFLWEFEGYKK